MDTYWAILMNVVLLFGLLLILSVTNTTIKQKNRISQAIFCVIIGIYAILIMLNGFQIQDLIYDTRTVLISLSALFFSPITTVIATAIAVTYRAVIGGVGIYAGIASILSAALIGVLWRQYVYKKTKLNIFLEVYLDGFVVHIGMLLSQLLLPNPLNINIILHIGFVVLVYYPFASLILSIVIINHEKKVSMNTIVKEKEANYKTIFDNSPIGLMRYDNKGIITYCNQEFVQILNSSFDKLIGLNLLDLPDKLLVRRLNESFEKGRAIYEGMYHTTTSNFDVFVRVQFVSINLDGKNLGGIGTVENLTETFDSIAKIKQLTTFDSLTGLYNRAMFDEFLISPVKSKDLPISIAVMDINTFHIINESFGYDVGNLVLKTTGSEIITNLPLNAKGYRIGGDEFAIVMPNTSIQKANQIIQNIKLNIKSNMVNDFNINISTGVSDILNAHDETIKVVNEAYRKMYSNKIYDESSISIKTIDVIMTTLFDKSPREMMHSERVGKIAGLIAKEYDIGDDFAKKVILAGKLHDIGKVNISSEILDKPAKLTDDEYYIIKKHPESGYRILNSVPEYESIADIVLMHHEYYDGSGYPKGLSGKDIPLAARIITVADAYDAMRKTRTYRTGLSLSDAVNELNNLSGKQFDPEVVEIFLTKIIDKV